MGLALSQAQSGRLLCEKTSMLPDSLDFCLFDGVEFLRVDVVLLHR